MEGYELAGDLIAIYHTKGLLQAGYLFGSRLGLAERLCDEVFFPFANAQGPQVIIVVS
jgi:hypothetical protein